MTLVKSLFALVALVSSVAFAEELPRVSAYSMTRTLNGGVLIMLPKVRPFEDEFFHFNEQADARGICLLFGFLDAAENSKMSVTDTASEDPSVIVDTDGQFRGFNVRGGLNTNSFVRRLICYNPVDWASWHTLEAPEWHRMDGVPARGHREAVGPTVIYLPRLAGSDSPLINADSDKNGVCRALGFERHPEDTLEFRIRWGRRLPYGKMFESYNTGYWHTTRYSNGIGWSWRCDYNKMITARINEFGYFESFNSCEKRFNTNAYIHMIVCE